VPFRSSEGTGNYKVIFTIIQVHHQGGTEGFKGGSSKQREGGKRREKWHLKGAEKKQGGVRPLNMAHEGGSHRGGYYNILQVRIPVRGK